jgi:hypothetical protein
MTLLKEENNAPVPYATILIVLGIIGILLKFGSCNGSIDEGLLTSKEVTIMKSPELIPGTKHTSAHYLLSTNEYLSPFHISGTALAIVKNNGGLQQLQANEILQVIILNARQNYLDNPLEPVEVFGLTASGKEYFSPGMLAADTHDTGNKFLFCGSALLIIGLVLKLRKITRPDPATR